MDKTEQFIREELLDGDKDFQLDIDSVIAGTHSTIKKRAIRRKAIYSSPVVLLLVIVGLSLLPRSSESTALPGSELFMTGWAYSWTEAQDLEMEAGQEIEFYDQTVDYLIDNNHYSYFDDAEALLDEYDLEALKGYLEEA